MRYAGYPSEMRLGIGDETSRTMGSWSFGRVVRHSNRRKPAFSLSGRSAGASLPAKGQVTNFPLERGSKNGSAQLVQMTTNLPSCSRKVARRAASGREGCGASRKRAIICATCANLTQTNGPLGEGTLRAARSRSTRERRRRFYSPAKAPFPPCSSSFTFMWMIPLYRGLSRSSV